MEKSRNEFHKSISYKDGYLNNCKICQRKIRKQKTKERHVKDGKYTLNYWIKRNLSKHSRKFIVNINISELEKKWTNIKHCEYCGIELNFLVGKGYRINSSASIDRENNDKIMTINNIRLVCWECNNMKSTNTYNHFLRKCKQILSYQKIMTSSQVTFN